MNFELHKYIKKHIPEGGFYKECIAVEYPNGSATAQLFFRQNKILISELSVERLQKFEEKERF